MQQAYRDGAVAFEVLAQERRQPSVNVSMVSTLTSHGSYQQLLSFFQSLSSEHIDMPSLHSSSKLKLKKYKQAVYYGEFNGGKRHGAGLMFYHTGQRYDGYWQQDMRHGKGYELFPTGCTYLGQYQANKMHGQGCYIWPQGQKYEGEWQNNYKHGMGLWEGFNGETYVGEWQEGKANGWGVYTELEGSRYEGQFKGFVKDGQGTEVFSSGDVYKGTYVNGLFDGYGEYLWTDGSFYKGNFKQGLRHGSGTWKRINNPLNTGNKLKSDEVHPQGYEKYEGEFNQNRKEGYGITSWSNGDTYKGNYIANLRHGNGQMYWTDGSFFKGNWMADQPNGKGQLFDGKRLTRGIFKDGCLVQIQQDTRGISQFYFDNYRPPTQRVIVTPIRKITEDTLLGERLPQRRRLVLSQVERDAEVREIKVDKGKKRSPLVEKVRRDSFVRKKLNQTIALQPVRDSREAKGSRLQSREKVLHSAFQIHRLYNNKGGKTERQIEETADSKEHFAFSGSGRSWRYKGSRLE